MILRNEDRINDELLRTIERELDLSEARYQNPRAALRGLRLNRPRHREAILQ